MIRSLLNRYMLVQTLMGLGVALLVVGTVIVLVDFVEQSRAVGTRADVGIFDLLTLTLLKAPALLETTLPFVFLFGMLTALFRLNRRSELVVMRASGVSAWRILNAPIFLAITAGIASATLLNPLGAQLNVQYEQLRDRFMNVQFDPDAEDPVWLRETTSSGFIVVAADALDDDNQILISPAFLIYSIDAGRVPRLERRIDAEQAQLMDGYWDITGAEENTSGGVYANLGDVSMTTSVGRQALFERSRSPNGVAFWDLPELIQSAEDAGLASQSYELRWHGLLATPLTFLAATLIAAAATLRLQRLGGAAALAIAGGAAGFIMFFLQELLVSMGTSGTITPAAAAWSAPALTSLLALSYIASTEDG